MRSLLRSILIGAVTSVTVLVAVLFLPHDRYIRWQDMRVEAYARLGWMFERIHFDTTPVDLAFIGTSHTLNGIDAAAVARAIARADPTGTPVNAVNFAIPSYGRNLQWLIARELLETRHVRTLVIELFENETRKPHPLFVYPAEVSDVVGAPLLINLNYFHDLVRLPWRQISLAVKSLWPEQFGLKAAFDPARYDGPTVDNTRFIQVGGRQLTPLRDSHLDPALLKQQAGTIREGKNLSFLGPTFESLEYRFPLHYLYAMLDLAAKKGVEVKFLYLPGYGQPPRSIQSDFYVGRGDMLTVEDILAKPENWFDVHHLNLGGAADLSARIGTLLASASAASPPGQRIGAARAPEPVRAPVP